MILNQNDMKTEKKQTKTKAFIFSHLEVKVKKVNTINRIKVTKKERKAEKNLKRIKRSDRASSKYKCRGSR